MPMSVLPIVSLNSALFTVFGFEVEIWQLIIVGVLIAALIACIVVAASKSGKKRKVRIRKYIENEEKAISLRKKLRAANEEISRVIFEYNTKKNALNANLKKINEDYRVTYGRADSEYLVASDKLTKLNEKLRELSLRLKKKGVKPAEQKVIKSDVAKLEAEHDELAAKVAKMREEKSVRDAELKSKTDTVENELASRKETYDAEIAEKTAEKQKLEDELEKLAASQVKISVKDAEAIMEEFRQSEEADKQIRIKQAQDDVERAKNDYLEAKNLRAQYERERDDAVISAKEDVKRKLALETAKADAEKNENAVGSAEVVAKEDSSEAVAKQEVSSVEANVSNASENVTPDENDGANQTAATETAAEEVATEKVSEPEETTETETVEQNADKEIAEALETLENTMSDTDKKHSEELIAEVEEVEEEATQAEEAVEEDTIDETAANEPVVTANEAAQTEETAEAATDNSQTEEIAEAATDNSQTEEFVGEEAIDVGETHDIENEETDNKIIRLPKIIYNDGIPATPIHKKSKYAKPVTKLLVKKPAVKEENEQVAPAKEETRKSAYLGKWKTETTEDGKFFAKLRASNGGILLVTPLYSSEAGLKNGISSIKKGLATNNVTITANKAGKFVFKVTSPSGRAIVTSEQYAAKFQCEKALDSAKRFAETAVISD